MAQMANASILHRVLGLGATALAVCMVVLRSMTASPPMMSDVPEMGYIMAGASAVMLILAVLVFSPRVPERNAAQSVDAYWMQTPVLQAVTLVWFLAEGAAIMSAIGYYLTGHLATASTMVVSLAAYWWLGPNTFSKP